MKGDIHHHGDAGNNQSSSKASESLTLDQVGIFLPRASKPPLLVIFLEIILPSHVEIKMPLCIKIGKFL